MDKKTKFGENFGTHKPQSWVQYTRFLTGHHSPADRARELFKSGLNMERLVVSVEKKNFRHAISAFLAMFPKPQDVLKCFDRFIKTIRDVYVAWECVNRAESAARNRARFKRILKYSTRF